MNDLVADRMKTLQGLLKQLMSDSENLWSSDPALARRVDVMHWKLSDAVSEMHEQWEEDDNPDN